MVHPPTIVVLLVPDDLDLGFIAVDAVMELDLLDVRICLEKIITFDARLDEADDLIL
jgi:hypothetical protein